MASPIRQFPVPLGHPTKTDVLTASAMRYRLQRRRRLGCALSIALLGATTTGRKAAAEDITAVYSAFWAGLPAGQIRVKLRDSGSGYSDEIEISTQGLPRLFTRFRATARAEGRAVANRPEKPSTIWLCTICVSGAT